MGTMKTTGFAQALDAESATALERIGTIRVEDDGCVYVYSRNGGTALAAGKLTQNSVVDSNAHNETVPAAAAIGATSVSITFGSSIAANYYRDGYMHVNDATGEGYKYRIKGHPAAASGNSYTVYVDLYDPIKVALEASTSVVTFTKHPQDSVVVFPTTQTGAPAGIPLRAVTAYYYFWNQVKGPAVCLTYGTIVIGNKVQQSTSSAGAVQACATDEIIGSVGTVLQVNATTQYSLINLAIPGY